MCFKGTCHVDNSSEADVEAATDPFLCPFLGPSGPMYLKGSMYDSDPFEAYHTGMWFSFLEFCFLERPLEALTLSPDIVPIFKRLWS